jgi:hypothetical protein
MNLRILTNRIHFFVGLELFPAGSCLYYEQVTEVLEWQQDCYYQDIRYGVELCPQEPSGPMREKCLRESDLIRHRFRHDSSYLHSA